MLVFILVTACSSVGRFKTDEEYWRETKLDRAALNEILRPSNCTRGMEYAKACAAAEAVLTHADPALKQENITMAKAYNAYLESLIGSHTALVPRNKAKEKNTRPDKELQGLGVDLVEHPDGVEISLVRLNSGAYTAALLAQDVILAAKEEGSKDWHIFKGMSSAKIIPRLRGEKGTKVSLLVQRGKRQETIIVERKSFIVSPIEVVKRLSGDKNILHLYVNAFYDGDFCNRVSSFLLEQKPYEGIILDLRVNGGGSEKALKCLASFFLPPKTLLFQESLLKEDLRRPDEIVSVRSEYTEEESFLDITTPMVVLVSRLTASASEYTAAAFQDHERAIVIGETTFGKGTSQTHAYSHPEVPYLNHHSDVELLYVNEIGKRPNGEKIETIGITPDIKIEGVTIALGNKKRKSEKLFRCLKSRRAWTLKEAKRQERLNPLEKPTPVLAQGLTLFQCGI